MSFGGGFLRHPDLFPARRSGEPWGDRAVALDVAGGPYLLSGLAAPQEEALRRRFGPLCGPAEAGGTVTASAVFRAPAADFLPIDTRGWEYTLDLDPAPGALRVAGLHLMARLDWTPALAGALWTPRTEGEEWASVCENYLRMLTAYRLLEQGGALLHSAGVSDGEVAWLLLGPSGAGKTTASRLCLAGGATVLSDDLNAVLFAGGEARLRKLPFTGDLGERAGGPESVPLRAVLRLAQGEVEGLRPLSPAAALAALVAASPFVNRDPWRREALLAVLERLARSVPAWEVTFSREGGLWGMLKAIR
ncbi:MAG: hypothetical protein ACJ76N_07965 [Thermoanaerobaculia bacterium]